MKKLLLSLVLILAVGLLFTACNNGQDLPAEDTALAGTPADILNSLVENCDVEMVGMLDTEITADNVQRYLGLSADQLSQYVTATAVKEAAINAQAHLLAVVQCVDNDAAAEVKSLIAQNFDPQRWVCVLPEQCFVVEAGNYVFLAATYNDVAEALKTAFANAAGSSMGEITVFYPN